MFLFNPFLDSPETASQWYTTVEASLVQAAALLFSRGSISTFDEAANQFISSLDSHIGSVTAKFSVQGPEIASSLLAMLMDFGTVDFNTMQLSPSLVVKPMDETTKFLSSEEVVNRAGSLFRKSAAVVLQRIGDEHCLPFAHVILAFLYCLSSETDANMFVETNVPWVTLGSFLNTLQRFTVVKTRLEGPEFPMPLPGLGRQLLEDFIMRGLAWTKNFYPPGFFECQAVEDKQVLELAAPRAERCLWLGIKLASVGQSSTDV